MPVVLERDESGRIVFGRMTQPVPRVEPVEHAGRRCSPRSACERSTLPIELYDNGATAHRRDARLDEDEVAACAPDGAAIAALAVTGVNCFAGARRAGGEAACSGSERRGPGDRLGRRPARLPPRRHGLVAWGEEIVISQGVEIGPPVDAPRARRGRRRPDRRVEVGGAAVIVARGEFRL